jgi:hypothetical protein
MSLCACSSDAILAPRQRWEEKLQRLLRMADKTDRRAPASAAQTKDQQNDNP